MAKTLKLPFLLSTILSPILGFFFMGAEITSSDIFNFLILWLVIFILIIIFQRITQLQDNLNKKAIKYGENFAKKIPYTSDETGFIKANSIEIPEQKTLLKEIVDLVFIGNYITFAISMIPLILIQILKEYITKSKKLENWEFIVITILTFFWILFLEKKGNLVFKTPLIPISIQLKWFIIAFTIILLCFEI